MLRIVTWLWRDPRYRWNRYFRYGPDHVTRLAASVTRNLEIPHEVVCITDDARGIDPSIRTIPLWDLGLREKGGCYVRLRSFASEMAEIIGERFVSVDIDSVVTGPLDPLFDRPDDFVIWRNSIGPSTYCGSMFMMTAGTRAQVWDEFDPSDLTYNPLLQKRTGGWAHPRARAGGHVIGSDQAWISTVLGDGEAVWTAEDGVMSFRAVSKFRVLPSQARIVFFHGPFDPSMVELQSKYPWILRNWRE